MEGPAVAPEVRCSRPGVGERTRKGRLVQSNGRGGQHSGGSVRKGIGQRDSGCAFGLVATCCEVGKGWAARAWVWTRQAGCFHASRVARQCSQCALLHTHAAVQAPHTVLLMHSCPYLPPILPVCPPACQHPLVHYCRSSAVPSTPARVAPCWAAPTVRSRAVYLPSVRTFYQSNYPGAARPRPPPWPLLGMH